MRWRQRKKDFKRQIEGCSGLVGGVKRTAIRAIVKLVPVPPGTETVHKRKVRQFIITYYK